MLFAGGSAILDSDNGAFSFNNWSHPTLAIGLDCGSALIKYEKIYHMYDRY